MYYITVKQHRNPRQITWEDVMADKFVFSEFANETSNSTATITKKFETIDENIIQKVRVGDMIEWLRSFNKENEHLFETERKSLYRSFKIPKATGGFRQIDAPCDELQDALRKLVRFLKNDCSLLYHTSAFAYIEGRSIIDCLKRHQKNDSKWYLKTDFSGFFPNTTLEFTMRMLGMVFPLSEVCKVEAGKKELEKAISLGFLNGGLPQGTVLSPMLTNLFMIPIDHRLFNEMAKRNIVYTRYADDMHISAVNKFPFKDIIQLIRDVLKEFGAPWVLKDEKTHYGSRNGRNWTLGLMVNKDNNITVGYRNKKYFRSALCSFVLDTKNGKHWDLGDVQHLRGLMSYYTMVEPEYFEEIVDRCNKKWNVDVKQMFRECLS